MVLAWLESDWWLVAGGGGWEWKHGEKGEGVDDARECTSVE